MQWANKNRIENFNKGSRPFKKFYVFVKKWKKTSKQGEAKFLNARTVSETDHMGNVRFFLSKFSIILEQNSNLNVYRTFL